MSISPGVKPGACFRFVPFEYRRQKAKAAEFISADYYHHPSKAIDRCRRPTGAKHPNPHFLIDPNQVYRFMVLAKGLRNQSRYCSAGTDKVASRAVCTLKGRDLTAFVVSFASAMRKLECKSGVSSIFS